MTADLHDLDRFVRDVPDFPQPGITFKDITPLLADPTAFARAIAAMTDPHRGAGITKVVGIEARGFIFAAPIAMALDAGFVPLRKAGKLPSTTVAQTYDLEYGSATLEVHDDAFHTDPAAPPDRVLVVDDVLATGGTARASMALIAAAGAEVAGLSFLIELAFLDGAQALDGIAHHAVLRY